MSESSMANVVFATILAPLIGAFVVAFLPSNGKAMAVKWTSLVVAIITFVATVLVFTQYDWRTGGFQFQSDYAWLDDFGIRFRLGIDGLSAPMLLLTGIVLLTAVLMAWHVERRPRDYFVLLLALTAGVSGTFAALDVFWLFLAYELAVVPMYLLIGVWGSSTRFPTFNRPKEYGAMKLTLFLVVGSILVWIGIFGLWEASRQAFFGTPTLNLLDLMEANFSRSFQLWVFPLMAIGFGVLAGMWPFHTWSPDGHVAAPTSVSMLHAGVLMKLGAYGILRMGIQLLPEGAQFWAPALMTLGTVNVVYGAISAMGQKDLKYVIGYSSVSHMGYVIMGLATLDSFGMSGAVLQMFSHGIMTALFFSAVGAIYERAHVRDIGQLEGLAKRMGFTSAIFVIAGLTSLGLPGLAGFVAEVLIFVGTFRTYPLAGILAVIAAGVTAAYILRLIAKVFFGPLDKRWAHLTDASRSEAIGAAILVVTLVVIGVYPKPFLDVINSGVEPLLRLIGS